MRLPGGAGFGLGGSPAASSAGGPFRRLSQQAPRFAVRLVFGGRDRIKRDDFFAVNDFGGDDYQASAGMTYAARNRTIRGVGLVAAADGADVSGF